MIETNTKDISAHNVCALICGHSGAGKTYALGTLPEEETLIIAIDPGLLTLKGRDFVVWKIGSVDDMREAFTKLKNGTQFKYVCIDSLTELGEVLFSSLKPQFSKSQTFDLYNSFSAEMISMIKAFRSLEQYHIFMTTLLKESDDGLIIDVVQKSLGFRLPSYFDFTFLVRTLTKDDQKKRFLISDNDVLDYLKSRSKNILDYEEVNLKDICDRAMS